MELGSRRFAKTVVLSPAGRIDHATAEAFKTGLLEQVKTCAAGQDHLVLDLGGVEYIASAGLRALMIASKQVTAQGGTIAVAALRPLVQEVFEISRFTLLFRIFPSVRQALSAIAPDALMLFDADRRG